MAEDMGKDDHRQGQPKAAAVVQRAEAVVRPKHASQHDETIRDRLATEHDQAEAERNERDRDPQRRAGTGLEHGIQARTRRAEVLERLVNAQRTMLAGASHELCSPLARIRMAIELLPSADRPELQARLTQDIAELDTLIGELLLASRLDTLEALEHTEDVDVLALLAEEGARIGAEVSGEPACIQGDPRMLRRLLRNLFENARRYAAGAPVEASVLPLVPTGVRLCIADRGPGVPEPERERIFAPFYRPAGMRERGEGGVGLGLALVRQIARHHGGDVRCVPRDGGGTCFAVTLRTTPERPLPDGG